jgi:hypothetical protein
MSNILIKTAIRTIFTFTSREKALEKHCHPMISKPGISFPELASVADVFFFTRLSQLFCAFLSIFFFQPVFLLILEPPAKRPARNRKGKKF